MCSLKAPWRARTPIVILRGEEGDGCVIVLERGGSARSEGDGWVEI